MVQGKGGRTEVPTPSPFFALDRSRRISRSNHANTTSIPASALSN